MRTSAKGFLAILLATLGVGVSVYAAPAPNRINLPSTELGYSFQDDEDEPEVTDRVARVSVVDGEAKIRRADTDEWEKVTSNLPLVEGDEIATSDGSRLEIQFAKNQHIRLDENSYLKIVTLKDEGIALSVSLGSISVRLIDFDRERAYFEIDAPKATFAIEKSGRYRIDAGKEGDAEIRTSISEGGEARIYTEYSGFTLKNNRSARIFIDGGRAGEWEPMDTPGIRDDFDAWSTEREDIVAKQLRDSYFGKYYDDDIYGAEELDDNGEWLDTPEYGHVWRPSRLATVQYADWSPYRYGYWRYMQPYGWFWVNDEPWGWATYHYGRWVYYNGQWVWAPYGYYRPRRSWWWPAYVSINVVNDNVCWYPLGYYRRRHHFNRDLERPRKKDRVGGPRTVRPVRPMPIPAATGKVPRKETMPPTGVVGIGVKDFGSGTRSVRALPPAVVKDVLSKQDNDGPIRSILPERRTRQTGALAAEGPKIDTKTLQTRTGAAPRSPDKPMDEELRKTKIFGGRPPRPSTPDPVRELGEPVRSSEPRKTGTIERQPSTPRQVDPIRVAPEPRDSEPVKTSPKPVKERPKRVETVRETPVYMPPAPERKKEIREVRETPRYDPPPRQTEKPRDDSPVKSSPPAQSDPPKTESKPETKSDDKPAPSTRKEKP